MPGDEIKGLCEEGHLEKAMDVLQCMNQQGIVPSEQMYGSLLKLCTKRKALAHARRVRSHLAKHGLDSTRFLGEYLVQTLVRCGGLQDALDVFRRLQTRTSFSSTALIWAFAGAGRSKEAIEVYRRMQEEGLEPDKYTFISLLKACGSMSNLEQGRRIHAEAVKYNCDSDLVVGTCLVDMYARCESLVDAHCVFQGLSYRDLVSWNAMLSACNLQNQADLALQLYEQMLGEGVNPDDRTFLSIIQACGMLAGMQEGGTMDEQPVKQNFVQKGKAAHFEAWRRGYQSDVFIGSALVSMYSKFGSVLDAQIVFDELSKRDLVSWTSMLSAYVKQGEAKGALGMYEEMQEKGVSPDSWIFVNVFQACGVLADTEEAIILDGERTKVKALQLGKVVHAHALSRGLMSHAVLGNALLSMYGECGSIRDAKYVFENLVECNVISWTAMCSVYLQQGLSKEAMEFITHMLQEGCSPNQWTFVGALQACGDLADNEDDVIVCGHVVRPQSLLKGKAIHSEAWRKGWASGVILGSALVSMYGKCGSIVDARHVFDGLSQRNIVSWNAMIAAYVLQGQAERAMDLYEKMAHDGVSPDNWTFVSTLQACAMLANKEDDALIHDQSRKVRTLQIGKAIHAEVLKRGNISEHFVGNTLISMYGKCKSTVDAQAVFDTLPQKDLVSWNVILSAYSGLGQVEKALQLYEKLRDQRLVSDDATVVHLLQACGIAGALDTCVTIHESLVSTGSELSPLVASTLIHVYGKLGKMQDAQSVFDAQSQPDVVSWTSLIAGYARQGNFESTVQCYEKMLAGGVKPNGVTFLSLLSACSHAGMVDRGICYFESMLRQHDIEPQIEHYVSVVDLLGRAGCFGTLVRMVSSMRMQSNSTLWMCLLSACRKHSNVELGRHAFNRVVELEPNAAAAYIMMSDIYTRAGLWEAANEVLAVEQELGAWKKPAECWIELEQKIHSFMVGDYRPPLQEQVYKLLARLSSEGVTLVTSTLLC